MACIKGIQGSLVEHLLQDAVIRLALSMVDTLGIVKIII